MCTVYDWFGCSGLGLLENPYKCGFQPPGSKRHGLECVILWQPQRNEYKNQLLKAW